jgi:hypothetical protein
VLHAFMLWHDRWKGGIVRIACNNSGVVDALNKHSIKGLAIIPLQRIFLISAVSHIAILAFWIPSGENMVADAASRFDYAKLADLGMQVSQDLPRPVLLRQKLHSFFRTPSLRVQEKDTNTLFESTNPSVQNTDMYHSLRPLRQYHIGLLDSSLQSKPQPPVSTSASSNPSTFMQDTLLAHLQTSVSNSSSRERNVSTESYPKPSATLLRPTSSSKWFVRSRTQKKESTSRQHSVWDLPPSYDLENLRGILGPQYHIASSSPGSTSFSKQRGP